MGRYRYFFIMILRLIPIYIVLTVYESFIGAGAKAVFCKKDKNFGGRSLVSQADRRAMYS